MSQSSYSDESHFLLSWIFAYRFRNIKIAFFRREISLLYLCAELICSEKRIVNHEELIHAS